MADDKLHESENNEMIMNTDNPSSETVMSKNKLKKLAKRQHWLEMKEQRRAKEKLKRKQKIQQAKESGRDLGPSRKLLKSLKMSDSTCKLKICFDLSMADEMTHEEFSKTFKQMHRCYSINRRAPAPLQLYMTGYSDSTKQKMLTRSGCFNWDVNFNSLPHTEVFKKEDIVYLTSDSPNVIDKLDNDKVYIIGALVDHNRLKNFCYNKAIEDNVEHARLPLDLYFNFKTRKVLTIDQVYSIFLRVTQGKSWIDAVMDVVPKRKGVEVKEDLDESVKEIVPYEAETKFKNEAVNEDSSNGIQTNDEDSSCDNFHVQNNDSDNNEEKSDPD
ncbi:tRNA methyltransferase 10 homolog A [Caerostris darwini]|uniref:tRNA (guanine(9)-N(1))-methyltransferase n=1 Tax=Caerostris darwini TaxID=1538125 RepID=A0AAV4WTV5_9ARAC|nr:tRNA methyltransferase 10 homolog A [Caerostris darwini]